MEQIAKKLKGEEGGEEWMQRMIQSAVQQTDEKWQKRMEERDATWENRAKGLLHDCATMTDAKIKSAIEQSEHKQDVAMKKLKEEMVKQFKGEISEMKSAVGAAGGRNTDNQTGSVSKISHQIGAGANPKTYRARDPSVLQFGGKEAIDKKQAAKVIEETLTPLGVKREDYTFGGPPRGSRFSVKFKAGAAQCTQPDEAAKFVKNSFAPKGDEGWTNIKFNREPDGEEVEYSFQYDIASNQQIKEIVVKHLYNMIKDKQGADDYKMFKREGSLYKKFKCIARVIVGYQEDTFQVKWVDAKTFEETGVKTEDAEKELRNVFAKWCL